MNEFLIKDFDGFHIMQLMPKKRISVFFNGRIILRLDFRKIQISFDTVEENQ